MRELTYYVATTVDGFIAAPDGSFDAFLSEGPHLADLFAEFPETVPGHLRELVGVPAGTPNRHFDTVLMGRATYEVGLAVGVTSPYPHLRQYVFSGALPASPDPAVRLVRGDPLDLVRQLKAEPGELGIWLCGGGALASALLPEIDQLVLKVNPVLLGAGIRLFAGAAGPTPLRLEVTASRGYDNGFTLVRYRVMR